MHEDQAAETEAAPVDPAPPPQPGWMTARACGSVTYNYEVKAYNGRGEEVSLRDGVKR